MREIKLKYITNFTEDKERLLNLYTKYYGKEIAEQRFKERIPWYSSRDNFKVLIAEVDGEYVGQSCAYSANAYIKGKKTTIFWSVDTFVLGTMRGLGIGKKLQKKLHEDCPNFSSAWYSPANGAIKRKCGGKELFNIPFCYYPVGKLYSVYIDRVIRRIFKREIHFRFPVKHIYSRINFVSYDLHFAYSEISYTKDVIQNISTWLGHINYDFYIERDADFINWKYNNNPNLKYHLLEIKSLDRIEGYIAFTEPYETVFNDGNVTGVKILDFVKKNDSLASMSDVLFIIIDFYKRRKQSVDGIFALSKIPYKFQKIIEIPVLSTLTSENIHNPYLSYIDQDMEQM